MPRDDIDTFLSSPELTAMRDAIFPSGTAQ
jgi:hypothetical protein